MHAKDRTAPEHTVRRRAHLAAPLAPLAPLAPPLAPLAAGGLRAVGWRATTRRARRPRERSRARRRSCL
eukprot:3481378-Prymnesium_polylepis.1